jgi:hypothetical protein
VLRCSCSKALRTARRGSGAWIPFRLPRAHSCAGWRHGSAVVEPASAAEVARALADVLERRGLPYAIGGAIALGFYAVPRATVDVDVNIFVSPDEGLAAALEALAEAGFVADDDEATLRTRATSEGQFRGTIAGMRVDVFVPAIPYYAELATRRRHVSLLGRPLWVLGPEDLVVLKLIGIPERRGAKPPVCRGRRGGVAVPPLVGSDSPRLHFPTGWFSESR